MHVVPVLSGWDDVRGCLVTVLESAGLERSSHPARTSSEHAQSAVLRSLPADPHPSAGCLLHGTAKYHHNYTGHHFVSIIYMIPLQLHRTPSPIYIWYHYNYTGHHLLTIYMIPLRLHRTPSPIYIYDTITTTQDTISFLYMIPLQLHRTPSPVCILKMIPLQLHWTSSPIYT